MMLFVGEPGIIRKTQNGNVDLISIEAMFGVDPTPTWETDRRSHVRYHNSPNNDTHPYNSVKGPFLYTRGLADTFSYLAQADL